MPRGAIVGLLGGNGAGKTTTIAMIMGLVLPTAGTAKVLGTDMARDRHRVLHRINFESPYVEMPKRLTVRQNLRVFGALYNVTNLNERIESLPAELELTDLLDRPTGELSSGQKTRVALAKALINTPDVLLLDEPTASLDPDTADWIRSHIERYRREHQAAILLASHNMPEVERLCDDVLMMKAGKIVDQRRAGRSHRTLRAADDGGGVPRRRPRPARQGGGERARLAVALHSCGGGIGREDGT